MEFLREEWFVVMRCYYSFYFFALGSGEIWKETSQLRVEVWASHPLFHFRLEGSLREGYCNVPLSLRSGMYTIYSIFSVHSTWWWWCTWLHLFTKDPCMNKYKVVSFFIYLFYCKPTLLYNYNMCSSNCGSGVDSLFLPHCNCTAWSIISHVQICVFSDWKIRR